MVPTGTSTASMEEILGGPSSPVNPFAPALPATQTTGVRTAPPVLLQATVAPPAPPILASLQAPPPMTALTATSIASMGVVLAVTRAPAPALPVTWALKVLIVQLAWHNSLVLTAQLVLQATVVLTAQLLIPASLQAPPPMTALMATSTASTGVVLAVTRAPAPAQAVMDIVV